MTKAKTLTHCPHLPGLDSSVSLGRSSKKSEMDSCLKAILRKCFPPFTFQVPTNILREEVEVYSGYLSIMLRRIFGDAEKSIEVN